jgi:hypothetical protein
MRTPNTNSPEEVRRAIANLNTNVVGVTQVTVGNWNATTATVNSKEAHWDEAYSRELNYNLNLKCLISIF